MTLISGQHGWDRRAQQRLAALIIVICWAQAVLPRIIQSLTAPKVRAAVGEISAGYTRPAQLSKDVLTLVVLAVCVAVLVGALRYRRSARVGPLAIALAPWLYLMVRDAYVGSGFLIAELLYPAIVLAIWSLHPPFDSLRTLGVLIGVTAIGCMLMGVLWPDAAIFRSSIGEFISEDKQILPWGMLEGYLTQPNNLGQTLAVGLPAVFLVRPRLLRVALIGATGFALLWTASRSSLYAIGIAAVVAVVLVMSRPVRAQVAVLCVAAAACVVAMLPMVTRDPSAFTDRGYIWNISLEAWHASPWVGNGGNWYEQIASTAANVGSTVFHGHNQFVQLLVTGGLVLVCLVVWQYALVARRAARVAGRTGILFTTYLAVLFGTCMLEVSLAYVDNFSMLFVVAVPTAVIMFGEPTAISPTVAPFVGPAEVEPASVVSGGAGDG